MRQTKIHILRKLFLQIPTFSPTDPRFRGAWRSFKRSYLKQPRPSRSRYISALQNQVERLNRVTEAATT